MHSFWLTLSCKLLEPLRVRWLSLVEVMEACWPLGSEWSIHMWSSGRWIYLWKYCSKPFLNRALAGSAPILQFPGIYKCNQFMDVVTKDFTNYSPSCSSSIRNSWKAIRHVAESEEGRSWLSHQFQLCKPLAKKEDVNGLLDFLNNAWVSMGKWLKLQWQHDTKTIS